MLVLSHFEFEGFRTVMPAQAGIQGDQAAASGYSAWIPAFAGMTQHSSTPQNHHDRLLVRSGSESAVCLFFKREDLPIRMGDNPPVYSVYPRARDFCPAAFEANIYILEGNAKAFVRGKNRPHSLHILTGHDAKLHEGIDIFLLPRLSLGFQPGPDLGLAQRKEGRQHSLCRADLDNPPSRRTFAPFHADRDGRQVIEGGGGCNKAKVACLRQLWRRTLYAPF